ncbi:MAG: hypothetical protein JJ975_08210 [Bacteroidia bacterium]|nr:hypothetical protein [Bacteroidia bacterium]
MHNLDFIPTGNRYDRWLNRTVLKVRRGLKRSRYKLALSIRWMRLFVRGKNPSIDVFRLVDQPIAPLPITVVVELKSAMGFEVNGKRYSHRVNTIFIEQHQGLSQIELTVFGFRKNVYESLPVVVQKVNQTGFDLSYGQVLQPKMNEQLKLIPDAVRPRRIIPSTKLQLGRAHVSTLKANPVLPEIKLNDFSQLFYDILNEQREQTNQG